MNLYLCCIANTHPEVNTQYNYLVLAESKDRAIAKMQYYDGGFKPDFWVTITCQLIHPLAQNCWYLPLNENSKIRYRDNT
jgi:hypothetical protein